MDGRLKGERIRQRLAGVQTRKEAEQIASIIWGDMEKKALMGDVPVPTRREKTVTLGAFLGGDASRAGISPWTARSERDAHNALFRSLATASRPVMSLKTSDVEAYKSKREKDGLKPRGINHPLQVLRAALRRGVRNGVLSRVPCEIQFVADNATRRRALNRKEALALLSAAKEAGIGDEVTVFLNTGLRRMELFELQWSQVDFDSGTLSITTQKRGGASDRRTDVLPLNAAVAEVLTRRAKAYEGEKPPSEAFVFGIRPEARREATGKHKPAKKGTLGGVTCRMDYRFGDKLKRAARLAGIENPHEVTPHVLRHTFATCVLNSGATVRDTQALLRHRSPELTLRLYCHEGWDGMKRATDAAIFQAADVVEWSPVGHETRKKAV
ncbi:MAG: site-specific integrase [Sumerlaeia bacterium]